MGSRHARLVGLAIAALLVSALAGCDPSPSEPPVVIVVADAAALTAGEASVQNRLEGARHEVVVADDDRVTRAQVSASAFTILSHTVDATPQVLALSSLAAPIWVAKPSLFDDFGLAGPVWNTDVGLVSGASVTITAPGHPMAGGATGTVAFQTASSVSWGAPPASATVVATAASPARATAYTIAAGATLADGSRAPGCRLTFPLYSNGPTKLTATGAAMLAGTADWAARECRAGPPPPADDVTHVILVSVDGFNPDGVALLGPDRAPNLTRLRAEGASTLNARSAVERTRTLPNHTSMLTGRRVTGTGGHQITFSDDDGSTIAANAGSYVPGVFDVVHDAGGSTAMYFGSPKLLLLERSWDATNGAPDTTGPDDGRDKVDTSASGAGATTTDALLARLRTTPPTFSFLHLSATDAAGHAQEFLSPEYLDALAGIDGHIGDVLDAVAADPALAFDTVVIVTADHGGVGDFHGDVTNPGNYTIPFYAWGAGVAPGADLYALNPERRDPGTSQPAYGTATPPIRNGDAANLVTDLLGLPSVGGSALNTAQDLDLTQD